MRKPTFEDRNEAVYESSHLDLHRDDASGHLQYITGYIRRYSGIVEVFAQGYNDDGHRKFTKFATVWRGRYYSRRWDRVFTERGLATLASRFLSDVQIPRDPRK
jgi:hypothetical protein